MTATASGGPSPDPSDDRSESPDTDSLPYREEGPAVSSLVYYALLVTRRRRPLFAEAAVRERVEALVRAAAEGAGAEVQRVVVLPSTVRVEVEAPATVSPHDLVGAIRRDTTAGLKAEFEAVRRAHSVFVRRYLVTTVPVPETDVAAFAEGVPKR